MESLGLTLEMVLVLVLLLLTVALFVSEIVRVDVAAVLVMVTLGGLSALPGLEGLADVRRLFDGFASNAVISIIAVMIIGAGLDRTGVMSTVAAWITRVGGTAESRIMLMISGTVGIISSFMQNVGAAALFLPVVSRVSIRTEIPMSRLLMPMGFCAILGGTMTMVGSSPLILLNDLIFGINETLPEDQHMESFGLFSVLPIGLALVATGLVYFVVFGRIVLPGHDRGRGTRKARSLLEYFNQIYGIDGHIHEINIPVGSELVDMTIDEVQNTYNLQIIATHYKGRKYPAPPRNTVIEAPSVIAVIAEPEAINSFEEKFNLVETAGLSEFSETLGPSKAGIAEVVIPPGSSVIGKTGRELWLRKTYGLSPIAMYRSGQSYTRECGHFGEIPFQAGDTLVCHTPWDALMRLESNKDFAIVTSSYPREQLRPKKVGWAMLFFMIALGLVLFTDMRLSLCLLVGALGMIVSKVLTIDEAYDAVGWNTVFLLASLIPLGSAVQTTGTAEWIATQFLLIFDGMPIWVIQASVALLTTFFTLVMSNVGATVLLVPLAVNIALGVGADPALFALTVAISTSNSFLIPTHQVNALILGPGGYRVTDYMRAGGIMTILFLIVSLFALNYLI